MHAYYIRWVRSVKSNPQMLCYERLMHAYHITQSTPSSEQTPYGVLRMMFASIPHSQSTLSSEKSPNGVLRTINACIPHYAEYAQFGESPYGVLRMIYACIPNYAEYAQFNAITTWCATNSICMHTTLRRVCSVRSYSHRVCYEWCMHAYHITQSTLSSDQIPYCVIRMM
jgi:hypothetical protein